MDNPQKSFDEAITLLITEGSHLTDGFHSISAMRALSHGANPNVMIKGQLALHWAIQYQKNEFVDALLHAGADVNMANTKGETPLFLAATRYPASLMRLLDSGAKSYAYNGQDAGTAIIRQPQIMFIGPARQARLNGATLDELFDRLLDAGINPAWSERELTNLKNSSNDLNRSYYKDFWNNVHVTLSAYKHAAEVKSAITSSLEEIDGTPKPARKLKAM